MNRREARSPGQRFGIAAFDPLIGIGTVRHCATDIRQKPHPDLLVSACPAWACFVVSGALKLSVFWS
jgi:hypothetical protein